MPLIRTTVASVRLEKSQCNVRSARTCLRATFARHATPGALQRPLVILATAESSEVQKKRIVSEYPIFKGVRTPLRDSPSQFIRKFPGSSPSVCLSRPMPSCFARETGRTAKRQCLKDRNVLAIKPLMPPACVLEELPVSPQVYDLVNATRVAVSRILHDHDDRLVAIVGPCSIHDTAAALDYAKRLKTLAEELKGELVIIMRTYFEKPRTTVGWKGLINDPDLDASFQINKGLRIARELLLDVNALGLPVGLEFLDTISPQFTADLVSWGAIGARTTESQLHRELTSGLSMPMGFKNGTGGDLQIAVDATVSSSQPHTFLGLDEHGIASIVRTRGNKDCHVILRGGSSGPNFTNNFIEETADRLLKAKQPSKIMVDCSHGNSRKQHAEQANVSSYLADIVAEGNTNLLGIMIESNIVEGNQSIGDDPAKLVYGMSITDACINWEDTVKILKELAGAVTKRRQNSCEESIKEL